MKRLLSTKILTESQQRTLEDAGWELTQYDAISVEYLKVPFKPMRRLAVFSSKHAVRALISENKASLQGVQCLCVGETTSALLQNIGAEVLESAPSATELAARIKKEYTKRDFIYFCGDRRLDVLPRAFRELGVEWEEVIIYKTTPVHKSYGKSFDGILFFSPSGVESYMSCNTPGHATFYCIGPTTAAAAKKYTDRIFISESPGIDALISLAAKSTNPV